MPAFFQENNWMIRADHLKDVFVWHIYYAELRWRRRALPARLSGEKKQKQHE